MLVNAVVERLAWVISLVKKRHYRGTPVVTRGLGFCAPSPEGPPKESPEGDYDRL